MEDILLRRLQMVAQVIQKNTDLALDIIKQDNIESSRYKETELIKLNLETSIRRFSNELNEYFRQSENPSPDEISQLSEIQLKGEETVNELIIKLKSLQPNPSTSNHESVLSAKLPRFDLPQFNGDPLEWPSFWDAFVSNIDSKRLADVDKLMYLKSSLKGVAKEAVDGLEMRNLNYQIALKHLKERFGNEMIIIDAHYAALFKVKAAESNPQDCRRTLNEIEKHLRILQSLKENVNHNNLRFLLIEKFPEDIVYEVRSRSNSYTIEEMREHLEKIISAREDASRIKPKEENKSRYSTEILHVGEKGHQHKNDKDRSQQFQRISQNRYQNANPYRQQRSNQQNIRIDTSQSRTNQPSTNRKRTYDNIRNREPGREEIGFKRRRLSCIFCNMRSHYNDQCDTVKTIEERKKKLGKRCYVCFQEGHHSKICHKRRACFYCRKDDHNRALCITNMRKEETKTMTVYGEGPTILQTAAVKVTGYENKTLTHKCRILLDSGSQRSYVTQDIANKLKLPIQEKMRLCVFTFGSNKPKEYESPIVKLRLHTRSNDEKVIFANVVPNISNGIPYPHKILQNWKDTPKLADDGSLGERVDILVGNDYYFSIISTEKIKIQENLYLVNSDLGWLLTGKTSSEPVEELSVVTYFQTESENKFNTPDLPINDFNIKTLYDLETIGITDSPNVTKEEEAMSNFKSTTRYVDNRYEVCWPWKVYPPVLPTNFGLAYGRLVNLLKRLDNHTLDLYDQTLQEQLRLGIIERAPDSDNAEHPIHYLPHHCVQQKNKPPRIVYDASAKVKGNQSLNECLHCGPLLLEDLTSLIIRFRSHRIGITADVEKAFLQIQLQENDRDVTRFLWLKDIKREATKDNIQYFRFCRVPFGIISSPFLLNATIRHHLTSSNVEILQKTAHDIYVDNLVTGSETVDQAITLYKEAKKSFQEISMNLREWSSNSGQFIENVPDKIEEKHVKVLGLEWDTQLDTLKIRDKDINSETTMRGILKITASVFDPCGFAAPLLLPAKLLIQQLWKEKRKWDETLSKNTLDQWNQITSDFQYLNNIVISRPYSGIESIENRQYELHCFSDASAQAYAAVVYLRIHQGSNDNSKISFVIGKTRVAPMKNQQDLQIPRLELLGALIGSRLLHYCEKHLNLPIQNKYLWIDSEIVLSWLNTKKTLPPFINRRVHDIKKVCNLTIRYVPTDQNPADKGTRTNNVIGSNKVWIEGPEFLTRHPDQWPETKTIHTNVDIDTQVAFAVAGEGLTNDKDKTTEKVTSKKTDNKVEQTLPINDKIREIKQLQEEHFPEECNNKETNLSRNLKLFKDIDGILRSEGRMQYADWTYDKRYPILVPKNTEFTRKLIKKIHEENKHVGVNHTLSAVRQYYWIPQGKEQVKKVLKQCSSCVKHGGGPFKLPPTPALPPERVNYSAAFTFTGMDYMGPILVDTDNGLQKRWICLYTCLAVRALHLEIVRDLSAEEGLLALRRMIATRGIPALITSDNAAQFHLMADILSKPYCIENNIKWRFIPQLSPWFGGFYERLVSLVKNCMIRTIHKHLLNDSQLLTVIKEIEAVLNTRPLTSVDSELEHVLKPSDFLTMGRCITLQETLQDTETQGTIKKKELIKGWKRTLNILEEFKAMFINRYLPSLRERYNNSPKEPRVKSNQRPQIGQIVQIRGDSKNREGWKIGKITSLRRDKDGYCRVATIKVGDKEFTRSILQLYPLEVEEEDEARIPAQVTRNEPPIVEPPTLTEPMNIQDSEEDNIIFEHPEEPHVEMMRKDPLESESVTKEVDSFESEMVTNEDELPCEAIEEEYKELSTRPRRHAASQAIEKIRQWTRNLITQL